MTAPPLIGLADRRTDLSREIERANTHNELAEYRHGGGRVKTRRPYRSRSTLRSSHTGSTVSRTTPSDPNTR